MWLHEARWTEGVCIDTYHRVDRGAARVRTFISAADADAAAAASIYTQRALACTAVVPSVVSKA
jgi:hypothetical protein